MLFPLIFVPTLLLSACICLLLQILYFPAWLLPVISTQESWEPTEAKAVLSPYAVSQHAICLSQVNTESCAHSTHTNTSLQNTLPTIPFSSHLCLWLHTLPFPLVRNRSVFLKKVFKKKELQEETVRREYVRSKLVFYRLCRGLSLISDRAHVKIII